MTDEAIFEQDEVSDLPDSWVWTTIGAITKDIAKVQPADNPETEFYYLDISSIDNIRNIVVEPKIYVGSEAPSRARQQIHAHDVLFSTVRVYLRNIAQVPELFDGHVASTGFSILRGETGIQPKYLFYYCLKADFVEQLEKLQRGTSYPAIRDSDMREQSIPLAPLNEQRRIVDEIEAQFTRLDAGIAALKRLEANLKRYKASVLKAACEGDLVPQDPDDEPASELLARILRERREKWEAEQLAKYAEKGKKPPKNWQDKYKEPVEPDTDDLPDLPEGWEVLSMDALTTRITSGSRDWKQYYDRGTGTFLMAQNIRMGKLDLSYRQAVDPPLDDSSRERSQVEIGDLLVTIVGANTGDVAPVNENLPEHYVCQSVALMRPVDNSLTEWLTIYLTSPENGQKQYDRYIYGAGRPHLSFEQLKMTAIPLPSPDEQKRIVETFKLSTSIIDEIEHAIEINIQRAERLRQSILKEAFAGRLVPQDPSDEPASELLARIHAEREKES